MKTRIIASIFTVFLYAGCEKPLYETSIFKFYGDAREDIGVSIAQSGDDFIIAGVFTDLTRNVNYIESSDRNLGIMKVNSDGILQWKISAGGRRADEGSGVVVLNDGSSVCTGITTDTTATGDLHTNLFLVKVSADGDLLWEKSIGGAEGNQKGIDIIICDDGGFLITGYTDDYRARVGNFSENIAGKKDIFIVKTTGAGEVQWSAAYGFGGNDEGAKIKQDKNGNYIILGTTDTSDPGQDKNNIILIKINSLGAAVSYKILGGSEDEYAADIEVLTDGYFVAATVGKENEDQQIMVVKLPANIFSSPVYSKKFRLKENGIAFSSKVNAVTSVSGEEFILAGQVMRNSTNDLCIIVIDNNGNEVGSPVIRGGAGYQTANDVIMDFNGNVITTGKSVNKNNSMISFLKLFF